MNLNEALRISGIPLEEATITQIIKRINKHKAMTKSPREFTKHLADDNALQNSLGTVKDATSKEKEQYNNLMKDPEVAGAINNLPTPMRSGFGQLKNIEERTEELKKPFTSNAIKQLDPQIKIKLFRMQKEWFAKKAASEKQSLIATWIKEPITARIYKFGLKQGIFAMPKVA